MKTLPVAARVRSGRGTKSSRVGEVLAIATFYDPIAVHMNGTTATESIYKLEKPMRRWSNGRGITLVHACGHRRLGVSGGKDCGLTFALCAPPPNELTQRMIPPLG